MSPLGAQGSYRVVPPTDSRRNLVLEPSAGEGAPRFVLAGCQDARLPATLSEPRLERLDPASPDRRWSLTCREGRFELTARGVEVHEGRPRLFDRSLAPYALKPRDRVVVGWLLRLLRLPGGARLLRAWHARRR